MCLFIYAFIHALIYLLAHLLSLVTTSQTWSFSRVVTQHSKSSSTRCYVLIQHSWNDMQGYTLSFLWAESALLSSGLKKTGGKRHRLKCVSVWRTHMLRLAHSSGKLCWNNTIFIRPSHLLTSRCTSIWHPVHVITQGFLILSITKRSP